MTNTTLAAKKAVYIQEIFIGKELFLQVANGIFSFLLRKLQNNSVRPHCLGCSRASGIIAAQAEQKCQTPLLKSNRGVRQYNEQQAAGRSPIKRRQASRPLAAA